MEDYSATKKDVIFQENNTEWTLKVYLAESIFLPD